MNLSISQIKKYILFYIFLYIFNSSILSKIIGGGISNTLFYASIIFLLIFNKLKIIKKYQLRILMMCTIVFIIQIWNNHLFQQQRVGDVIRYSICLLLPFIIVLNKDLIKYISKYLRIFCLEHVFCTLFVQFFKNFYISKIMPLLFEQNIPAYGNLKDGYNPGITTHYSTNGTFLSISILYFFSSYMKSKKKKDLILLIISLIALLFNAKRAHLLFSIISCILVYFFSNKEKISKKIFKFTTIFICFFIIFLIISSVIPSLTVVISRFEEGYRSGNLLNGREELFSLAIKYWQKNKIIGNGWGSYSYFYHINYNWPGFEYLDAHNVYLQLLCECGIMGLLLFIYIAIKNLHMAIKNCINNNYKEMITIFVLAYQFFFLLYCFSGNPLYDLHCYSIYFLSLGINNYIYYLNHNYH